MPFTNYVSIVLAILVFYYFIVILFDLIKAGNNSVPVKTHAVQFPEYDKPVIISAEPEKFEQPIASGSDADLKKYMPPNEFVQNKIIKRKAPIFDLGLETISGEAYTVNAENLSKFMIA